ncbi:NADH/Ubiquinone/plastoquinone (complex I) [Thermocrinis albus DSM 14484]|uniref:NADH/Ubiquinone/plastoquinone (Complex I) n=1 Tax=Thermocrinis albus (strain DSM 14484 / JCM 11386 / HI 11/12) TaxID=638303 RepID=D3SP02_THEAH|nr:proton-conducting transporter membrane subunit [Thermocrinis albus]ADC88889.1 NADH/Ubiquinone/plastoquinone (complex I) [Thermocrinis albus DSM 14484]
MFPEVAIVIIPLLSMITSLFTEKRTYAKVSTLFTGMAFLLSLYVLIFTNKESSLLFLRFDGLGTLLASYILLVSTVIHKYSENYMKDEQGFKRYFLLLDLMTWNLLLLVLSNHLIILFASWHLMGVILYFLLTFNNRREQAVQSGRTALFTHRIADVPLLVAILLLYQQYGTFEISKLAQMITTGPSDTLWIVTLLVILSGIIKSAQIPFHVWLVYSMEGPTPVSALMHAGIVNAGAFIANRFAFMFPHDLYGLSLSFLIGLITAIVGSTLMLMQNDVKKALGYSTVGQMGYMMMEIGVGAFALALYHMMAHGIFKATLFLSSGGVIHEARRDTNIPRDEVYDALVKREMSFKEIPTVFYGAVTLIVPFVLVLVTHLFFEQDVFRYKAPLILLFFGWVTSAQILFNLFKMGKEKPLLTIFLGGFSLFLLLSVYTFMSHILQVFVFTYEGLQEEIYRRAFSNAPLFFLSMILSLILVLAGWVLIYFANEEKPLKLHLSLYAHLSRELYFPDLYKLTGKLFLRLARVLSITSSSVVPVYGFFYQGGSSGSFLLKVFLLSLFIPLFPISLITSYLIKRFWIYSYPTIALLGFITLKLTHLPAYEPLHYLAALTLIFHSVRATLSENFKESVSELYPALLSITWISGDDHFVLLLLPSLLLYLLGVYIKKVLQTDSFYYAGGLMEKMPIYSLLLVIVSLQACLTPVMPSFYSFFEALLRSNTLQIILLVMGWFTLGVAVALSVWRLLHGKPRDDIRYADILRR